MSKPPEISAKGRMSSAYLITVIQPTQGTFQPNIKMPSDSTNALKFVITGAGIAGLTCAYFVKRAGHDVVVLEKSSRREQLKNEDGGVRIPPNMMRLLQELPGMEETLNAKATKCAGILFHQCEFEPPTHLTARKTGPQNSSAKWIFHKKSWMIWDVISILYHCYYFFCYQHKDLHEHLYTLCVNCGVEIRHEFEVVEVQTSRPPHVDGPKVFSKSGEYVTGDIVIGADGKNSVARRVLLAEQDEAEEADSTTTGSEKSALSPIKAIVGATLSIPVSLLESDPELEALLRVENHLQWMVYMGDGTSVAMARYGPDIYLLDLTYGQPPLLGNEDEEWLSGGTPVQSVLEKVQEYDARVKKLISLAKTSHWNIQTVYDLQRYVSKFNQVMVVGDAAHSIYINGTHNTAAAFEDAFTLAINKSNKNGLEQWKRAR
ncbi:FAD NAD-binding domain-containing protein [Lentinula edodes]|uniref:FAD NAD-binding domain-containing protein n=1 Tax=Lentinula edodes TaxID=5353 RepID=A0A1Q3ED39_LENED|nr:FAD NAD-binding domain-containing protein [Lentinula edodes]